MTAMEIIDKYLVGDLSGAKCAEMLRAKGWSDEDIETYMYEMP